MTNGSNGLKIQSSASRSASTDAQHRKSDDPFARPVVTAMSDDNYILDILLSKDNNYMGTGFSKKQWDTLKELVDTYWHPPAAPPPAAPPTAPPAAPLSAPPPASPPAQKPCAPTSPELPPQPIPAPVSTPVPAQSYPPSPSVKNKDEVKEKQVYKLLRNVKQIRQKFGAAKKMPRIRVSKFFENCIGLPSKFGAVNIYFSRDEDPDAWYTTMLNHKQKLYRIGSSSMQLDATKFLRCFAACKIFNFFNFFNFSTSRPQSLIPYLQFI